MLRTEAARTDVKRRGRSQRSGARPWILLLGLTLLATLTGAIAAPAASADKALILSTTVVDLPEPTRPSLEVETATDLGLAVEVKSPSEWSAMTAEQFASYRVIILGDPACAFADPESGLSGTASIAAAEANRDVWGPVVDGNILVNGTDPVYHYLEGGEALTDKGIAFAAAAAGKTGLYVSLSCYYERATAGTPVTVLEPFGAFTVTEVGCFNDAHIVATHPAVSGLTDASLSNWDCSVHEAFDGWPAEGPGAFTVLAIARGIGGSYTAPDGSVGTPYILARGEGLAAGNIALSQASPSSPVGAGHTLSALVSDGGTPQPDETVLFTVVSGPHAGTTGTATTGADGTATFSYTGASPGLDTLTASFVDDRGITQTSNSVIVEWTATGNEPPSASAGGPYTGDEGASISIGGTASDPDGDALTATWAASPAHDVDAGAACLLGDSHSFATSIACSDDGTFDLTLTVDDGTNPPVSATTTLAVANVPPSVDSLAVNGGNAVACAGGNTVGVSFQASDPGSNDTLTGTIDWGDGSPAETGFSGSHLYAAGRYELGASASDDDGDSDRSAAVVRLLYETGGIMEPINADGSSKFKLGRVIPVKVAISDCHGGGVTALRPRVSLRRIGTGGGEVNEVVSPSAADEGDTMRYTGGVYLYNLSTRLSRFNEGRDLEPGRYELTISDPAIAPVVVEFDLRP
jgi:hypothetical protein